MGKNLIIPYADTPADLTPAELASVVRMADGLKKFLDDAKDVARTMLDADPNSVPGIVAEPGRRQRAWRDEGSAIAAMRKAGVNDPYLQKVKSPAQLEKELGEGGMSAFADEIEWTHAKATLKATLVTSGVNVVETPQDW